MAFADLTPKQLLGSHVDLLILACLSFGAGVIPEIQQQGLGPRQDGHNFLYMFTPGLYRSSGWEPQSF